MMSVNKKRKGVSPLIAAVLLIAFVVATAGILSNWFVSFSKERSQEITTKGEKTITCSYAGLYIDNAEYNNTETKISLEVQNTGTIDLTDFKLQIIYNNQTSSEYIPTQNNKTMNPGDTRVFTNSSVSSCGIDKVIFLSDTCPVDSRDKLTSGSITFYGC